MTELQKLRRRLHKERVFVEQIRAARLEKEIQERLDRDYEAIVQHIRSKING